MVFCKPSCEVKGKCYKPRDDLILLLETNKLDVIFFILVEFIYKFKRSPEKPINFINIIITNKFLKIRILP